MTSTSSRDRVLIVEDDPTTSLGLTELVRTWGFTTEAAADGHEALQRITDFRPSIVISDLVMPGMSGLELLRALKEDGGDMTVVILTPLCSDPKSSLVAVSALRLKLSL